MKLHLPVFHDPSLGNEFRNNLPESSFCSFRTFSLKRAAVERDYAQVSQPEPAQVTCSDQVLARHQPSENCLDFHPNSGVCTDYYKIVTLVLQLWDVHQLLHPVRNVHPCCLVCVCVFVCAHPVGLVL